MKNLFESLRFQMAAKPELSEVELIDSQAFEVLGGRSCSLTCAESCDVSCTHSCEKTY